MVEIFGLSMWDIDDHSVLYLMVTIAVWHLNTPSDKRLKGNFEFILDQMDKRNTYDSTPDERNHRSPILLCIIYICYRNHCLSAIEDTIERHTKSIKIVEHEQ